MSAINHNPGTFPWRLAILRGKAADPRDQEAVLEYLYSKRFVLSYILCGLLFVSPLYILFLLLPIPIAICLPMILLLFIPLVYFQIALLPIYRKRLLMTNNIPSEAIPNKAQLKKDLEQQAYNARYRRHPEQ